MKFNMSKSRNCNDYIIKDGNFIRDFETMYQEVHDPWSQEENSENDIHFLSTCFWLRQLLKSETFKIESILDIGCATGYQANGLIQSTNAKSYIGTDVSPTVIQRATEKHGDNRKVFEVDDISKKNKNYISKFDFIFSSRTLYYVAPDIETVIENVDCYLKPNGLFCFIYNQKSDSFTNKWLTYEKLDELLYKSLNRLLFAELSDESDESVAIGIYRK